MRLITVIVFLCCFSVNTEAKRDFKVELNELRINYTDSSLVKTLNYKLFQQKYIWIEFTLKRDLTAFEMKFKFNMLRKDNRRINLLILNMDGCKALESAYTLTLIATITKEIFRKSNLPNKCPLKADEVFYIKNYTFNEEDYPRVTPFMTFEAYMEFYFEKQYKGYLLLIGRVRKK